MQHIAGKSGLAVMDAVIIKTAEMKTLLLSLIIVAAIACSKSNETTTATKEATPPVVKIIAPVVSEYYKTGDPLCFKGNVLAAKQLGTVSLKIVSQGEGPAICMQFDYFPVENYFDLEKKVIIPSSLSGNCQLVFEAVDVNGNTGKAVLGFSSN